MYGRYLGIREQRAQLLAAASKGDVDEVRRLWEEGNTFLRSSAQYTLGVSPLIAAIRHGQHAVARFFIENKVYIHQKGGKGRTPLFYACERRDEELVDLLLATTAEVKVRDGVGQTALIVAAQQGSVPIVRRLIEKCKEMVNFRDYLGQTALLVAAAGGYLEVVKELVLRGNADVSLADHDGVKPVSMAKMKGHQDCVDFLMEVVRSARENVVAAVRGGQTDEVTRLLTLGGAKLLKFRYGDDEKTLLMIAAEAGKADMVRMLANKIMFDVNAKSSGNKTALHLAVEREGGPALDVMKVLMEKHATLMYDDQGMTPLMHAAEKGLDGAVRVLVYNELAQGNEPSPLLQARCLAGLAKCALVSGLRNEAEQLLASLKSVHQAEIKAVSDIAATVAFVELGLSAPADEEGVSAADTIKKLEAAVSADPADLEARHNLALKLFQLERFEEAINQELEIIKRDKAWNAGAANQLLLKIFETLGPGNDLAKKSRARMTNLLFL